MFETEIARGVAWLDAEHPGWVDKVDLSKLSMLDSSRCVNAQITGGYYDSPANDSTWAVDHGFSLWDFIGWRALQDEWVQIIEKRRQDASVPA